MVQHRLDQRLVFAALETDVPATLERFTRFASRLDGDIATTRVLVAVLSAVAWRQAPARGRYTRVNVICANVRHLKVRK